MSVWETVKGQTCIDSIIGACNRLFKEKKEQIVTTCSTEKLQETIQKGLNEGWLLYVAIPGNSTVTLVFERETEV